MERAASNLSKAFTSCLTDRFDSTCYMCRSISQTFRLSPSDQSRKWGVYYVVGLILKTYFKVRYLLNSVYFFPSFSS
jgi:COP9 signalosome complex subunit 12